MINEEDKDFDMAHYTLNGSHMTTLDGAYAEIASKLNFPGYFGRNLDALEECLQDLVDREGSIELVVSHGQDLRALAEWPAMETVFQEKGIQVTLE